MSKSRDDYFIKNPVTLNGKVYSSAKEFSEEKNLDYRRVQYLMKTYGIDGEDLLEKAGAGKFKKIDGCKGREVAVFGKKYKSLRHFSEDVGLTYSRVSWLCAHKGYTPEQCAGIVYKDTNPKGRKYQLGLYHFDTMREFTDFMGLPYEKFYTLVNSYKLTYEECIGLEKCDKYYFDQESYEKSRKVKYKKCFRCSKTKAVEHFAKRSDAKCGYNSNCRECSKAINISRKYGLSKDEYIELFKAHNYKCAICGEEEDKTASRKSLHVDHCHETGKVRGILCKKCNPALGNFNDDITLLKKAIKYLEKNE